jgi:isoquinoline 1-oxidoreductase subunit beta
MMRMKRRMFLLGGAAVAGGLIIGYRVRADRIERQSQALVEGLGETLLAGWVKIGGDEVTTVYVPIVDVGQGAQTALAMMLADELDADWAKVEVVQAPAEPAFANHFLAEGWILKGRHLPSPIDAAADQAFTEIARFMNLQLTGGSTSVRLTGQFGMRLVGAAARQVLIEAAARRWQVRAGEVVTASGVASHPPSGRKLTYAELARDAARLRVPTTPALKSPRAFSLIGTSPPRPDIPAKVTGAARFGIDMRLPDMRYAAVKAAPVHGGHLVGVDGTPAMAIGGVEQVVKLDDAVAVVARTYWAARKALAALSPQFSDGGNGAVSSAGVFTDQEQALRGEGTRQLAKGDAPAALAAAPTERRIAASYRVPFLHHAALEPINATAQLADGRLTVWAGEREPLPAKMALAKLSGLASADVTFIGLPIGGAFGRRSVKASHSAFHLWQIAALARAAAPHAVKMIWSREEDFAQGAYRPQVSTRIEAALAPDHKPVAWSQVYVEGAPSQVTAFELPYAIANQSIRSVRHSVPIRQGSWRSVNSSQHGFWTESFIDELAHAAAQDPFEYRRGLLPEGSRERRVLETAATRAGWGNPLPSGVGRGIALVASFGSIVAHVVEASLDAGGRPKVRRVVAAVDCGDLVHPDTATQQIEGAIVMGLSAAIAEQITIERGAVVQQNFFDYPLLTLAQTPPIEVHLVKSDAAWGGLGEPGLPPVAPALANALFAATGRRTRTLPLAGSAESASHVPS